MRSCRRRRSAPSEIPSALEVASVAEHDAIELAAKIAKEDPDRPRALEVVAQCRVLLGILWADVMDFPPALEKLEQARSDFRIVGSKEGGHQALLRSFRAS